MCEIGQGTTLENFSKLNAAKCEVIILRGNLALLTYLTHDQCQCSVSKESKCPDFIWKLNLSSLSMVEARAYPKSKESFHDIWPCS